MNEITEKHIPLWLKKGIKELEFHNKYKMNYNELRNYYIEHILKSDRIIPSIELLKQDGQWYESRDLNKSGFDGFDLSYFMISYLISQNIDIENLLNDKKQLKNIESTLISKTINYYNDYFKTNDIKKSFEEINTPEELMDYMNKEITYGWIDKFGNKHFDDLKGIRENYKIKSLSDIIESKLGTCLEQAKLQKFFFDKNYIENKVYCFEYKENQNDQIKVHPITIYNKDNKWYHFEHAFYNYRGIHEFDNIDNLLESFSRKSFANSKIIDIQEIDDIPDNVSIDEFVKYIENFTKAE